MAGGGVLKLYYVEVCMKHHDTAVMQMLCCNSLNRRTKYDAKYRENIANKDEQKTESRVKIVKMNEKKMKRNGTQSSKKESEDVITIACMCTPKPTSRTTTLKYTQYNMRKQPLPPTQQNRILPLTIRSLTLS